MTFENKLKELNIKLPEAKPPVGSYVATKISGNFLFISGQISISNNGELIYSDETSLNTLLEFNLELGDYFVDILDSQGYSASISFSALYLQLRPIVSQLSGRKDL